MRMRTADVCSSSAEVSLSRPTPPSRARPLWEEFRCRNAHQLLILFISFEKLGSTQSPFGAAVKDWRKPFKWVRAKELHKSLSSIDI